MESWFSLEINGATVRSRFPSIILGQSQYDLDHNYIQNITSGKTPSGLRFLEEDGIPFIGGTSIHNEKLDLTVAPLISKENHDSILKNSQIQNGDVLVTMAGVGVGSCATFESDEECNANQAVAIIRLNREQILPKYLVKYFHSSLGQLFFGKLQHIAAQPNINLDEILKIKIVLPATIKDQQEILDAVSRYEIKENEVLNEIAAIRQATGNLILTELNLSSFENEDHTYFFKSGTYDKSSFFIVDQNAIK